MSPTSQFIAVRDARPPFFVGVDLGGSSVKVGVVDDCGRTLAWLNAPTPVELGPEVAAQKMGEAVLNAIAKAGLKPSDIARAGLGSPGTLDLEAGKMVNPVNFPGWADFSVRDRLSYHCGLPVAFANDASAAA